jgi:DNA-binding MarR family transcriptional regulator
MVDHAHELWSALVAVYQPVLRDVVTVLERDAGIDSGAYSVLAYLDQAGAPMPLRELQQLMRVRYSQPGLSRLIQRMERDGVVERRVDPDDRRATFVGLTRTGRARFRRAQDVYSTALDEQLGRYVPATEAAELARALRAVVAARPAGR